MARFPRTLALVAAAVCVTLLAGCGSTSSGPLELTGSVEDRAITVRSPAIPSPANTLDVGFESDETTPSPKDSADSVATRENVRLRVIDTPVDIGDRVDEGDILVVLDDTVLAAWVRIAEADATKSRADLALLGGRLDEASEGLEDIETQRSELETTVAELEEQRDDLLVDLEAARRLVGSPVPTGTPDPAETVVQLEAAIDEVDTGLDQAREALALLDETGGQLGDALTAIEGAQKAARAMVRGKDAAVEVAQAYAARAQVRAPGSGVVLGLPLRGDAPAPGAPLVTIRPDGATTITTWITAEQRERISLGAAASVTSDSLLEPLNGAVTEIGAEYVYAPTTFATKIIHMNRAFEVSIVVYGDETPPPGTPVDIIIETLDRLGS